MRGETTILADLDCQARFPPWTKTDDGTILLGTANPAMLLRLEPGFANEGQYTSTVLDAAGICLWGQLDVTADIPDGTSVTVQTRSGNVHDPDEGSWSDWSEAAHLSHHDDISYATPRSMHAKSPPARFFQYRLDFKGKSSSTPVVHRVEIPYLVPNLKPVVNSITATYADANVGNGPGSGAGGAGGGGAPPPGMRAPPRGAPPGANRGGNAGADSDAEPEPVPSLDIEWDATDPNNDHLTYMLEYQAIGTGIWLPLAKDLTDTSYEWNTRRVPDGRYLLRVTASDALDNPPDMALTATRESDPILVNNTPPDFDKIKIAVDDHQVTITGRVRDALSEIRDIHYAVDQTDKWQPVVPDGKMSDSTTESFTIKLSDLSSGAHMVTLQAVDGRSNARYVARRVDVK